MIKSIGVVAILGSLALPLVAAAEDAPPFATQKERVSYALGVDIGSSLKRQDFDIDPALLAQGLKDTMSGGKVLMTDKQVQEAIMAFQKERAARRAEQMKVQGEKNKTEGEAFLAESKKKEGMQTLPSGLQYKVITEGTGAKPAASDVVTVNYRGTLTDGTEFDSSYKRGQPATFPLKNVVPGWTEALQLMKVGAKWQLVIPPGLAYGERGQPPAIGPNAVLIFEVELLSIGQPSK